jgi:enamine deaminase RidA (YjgF/YER057c/UK114 family)
MAIKTKEINPGLNWYSRWPRDVTCAARKVDPDLVFVGGQVPLDPDDKVVGPGKIQEQAHYALTKFKECVQLGGGSMDDVVEVESFHTDPRHIHPVLEVAKDFFKKSKPTWNAVQVTGHYKPEIDIAFKGMAILNAKTKDINPGLEWYGKPPWDVAVPCKVANDLVIVGQACGMGENGGIVAPGNVLEENRYIMKKIVQCVEEAGGTSDSIVDLLGYTRDRRALLPQCRAIWEATVKDRKLGVRRGEELNYTAIGMGGFFHPDVVSTMRAYAVLGEKEKTLLGNWVGWRRFYPADNIPGAIKIGRYVFFAGEVMFDELFFEPTLEKDMPSMKRQARYAFNDYVRMLGTIGATMDNVVWIQPFSATWGMDPILEVAHEFFHNEKPAWTYACNSGLFLVTHLCEIYGMAIVDDD